MTLRSIALLFTLISTAPLLAQTHSPIPRRIPPQGIEIPSDAADELSAQVQRLKARLEQLNDSVYTPDAEVFVKAVDLAMRHGEFYHKKHLALAKSTLQNAAKRIERLEQGAAPWTEASGLVVRGHRSAIDGSSQPYGLVIPESLDRSRPAPLYVWLHGRGDKTTDMHFIDQRQRSAGQVVVDDAIVLHPFGRHCMGFKSAGEIDVLEAVEHVKLQYNIDPRRIVLMGFSMGGAGCWHLGAHYADRWAAISPGAGFAETAEYNRLAKANYPPWYEQKLWGLYDVPDYTLNLFNLPVVAYSGELDKQIQAARVMERAFASHGRELPHIIGPGMGHKYHPDSLEAILERMEEAREKGIDQSPKRVWLQTKTLRYSRMHWVEAIGLEEHWKDSRVLAERTGAGSVEVSTRNVTQLKLTPWRRPRRVTVTIDAQTVEAPWQADGTFVKRDGLWRWSKGTTASALAKRPGLQGPIDDVFLSRFLVVAPSGKSKSAKLGQWVKFELAHFQDRWRALFRGEPIVKLDHEVTPEDIAASHLILWGDATSNSLIARVIDDLPLSWTDESVAIGKQSFDASSHAPAMIYPNPLNGNRYVVLNSGPTFRERHDRTNSLQNPKLPDWAVIDLSQPPSGEAPGRIAAADFFDERWQVK